MDKVDFKIHLPDRFYMVRNLGTHPAGEGLFATKGRFPRWVTADKAKKWNRKAHVKLHLRMQDLHTLQKTEVLEVLPDGTITERWASVDFLGPSCSECGASIRRDGLCGWHLYQKQRYEKGLLAEY